MYSGRGEGEGNYTGPQTLKHVVYFVWDLIGLYKTAMFTPPPKKNKLGLQKENFLELIYRPLSYPLKSLSVSRTLLPIMKEDILFRGTK